MPPPPILPARFRGGVLNGATLPVRTTVGGWPREVHWAAGGKWLTYRLDGPGYALDAIGESLAESHDAYRRCPHCGSVTASPDLRTWLCVSLLCRGKATSAA